MASKCGVTSKYYHTSLNNPAMLKYYHYLDDPISWNNYYLDSPYWNRYHHEYERLRVSLMYQQNLIDQMTVQIRNTRDQRREKINFAAEKCDSILRNIKLDTGTISSLEREIASWQSSVSEMHTTLASIRSRTEKMGYTIETLKSDLNKCSLTLNTEFDIEPLLREMEGKRKQAELECTRIYSQLNLPSVPKITELERFCSICKSSTCEYGVKKETVSTVSSISSVSSNVCAICGSLNCTYGSKSGCAVCGSDSCSYFIKNKKDTTKYLVIVDEGYSKSSSINCSICGSDTCTYSSKSSTKVCDICFKGDCPYMV